jgi:hypothetical protein
MKGNPSSIQDEKQVKMNKSDCISFTCKKCKAAVIDNKNYICPNPHCRFDNEPPKPKLRPTEAPRISMPVSQVDEPSHYDLFPDGTQAIDMLRAILNHEEYIGYCKGNVLKYRLRAGKKGDTMIDIAKADWYEKELREVY